MSLWLQKNKRFQFLPLDDSLTLISVENPRKTKTEDLTLFPPSTALAASLRGQRALSIVDGVAEGLSQLSTYPLWSVIAGRADIICYNLPATSLSPLIALPSVRAPSLLPSCNAKLHFDSRCSSWAKEFTGK